MRPDYKTLLEWIKPEKPSAKAVECMGLLKPGDFEMYSDRLSNYVLEAREVFMRTGVSEMLRAGDLIVGIYNPAGDIVCASAGTYPHVVTSVLPIKFTISNWLHAPTVGIKEGDVFYCNEATYGGIHNPDQIAFMPVFNENELIAWTAACVHQPETGAVHPGGMSPAAKTRYEEGMRVPPIKIGENYGLREDLMEMFVNFVFRTPRVQMADMKARFSACDRLRGRLQELAREQGNDFLRGLFCKTLKETDEAVRRRIRQWNDGTYRAVVFQDTAGLEPSLIRCYMTLYKKGDALIIDLTGTSPEHDGGSQNALPHHAAACAAFDFFNYVFADLPVTNAVFAAINWIVPDGCVFSASPEAAIGNSPSIGALVFDVLEEILAKMIFDSPERPLIVAPTGGGSGIVMAGINRHGARVSAQFSYALNTDGQGARVDMDGMDAYGFYFSPPAKGQDVEDLEGETPVLTLCHRLQRDSCGFGKYRGGTGITACYAVHLTPQASYVSTGRESKVRMCKGIFGGYPGAVKVGIEIHNTDLWEKMSCGHRDLPLDLQEMVTKRTIKGDYIFSHNQRSSRPVLDGDIFITTTSSGAGYGDVLEREPEKVMDDLRKGIISAGTVENIYHVAYSPQTFEIDHELTKELRRSEKERRKLRGKKYEDFESEWLQKRPTEAALKHYGSWPDAKKVGEVVRG